MEAEKLKWIDTDYRLHQQAFLNFAVQATKKNGSPVYKKFEKFYNYEDALKRADEHESNIDVAKERYKEFMRKKKGESNAGL